MASAYYTRTRYWRDREKLQLKCYRLAKEWASAEDKAGYEVYWHTIPTPKPRQKPKSESYVTFERQRWERAGTTYNYSRTRKTCEKCKKQIPVPVRVMFDLKGK